MSDLLYRDDGGQAVVNTDGRTIEARLFEWGVVGQTDDGPEIIERGAIEGIDPAGVVFRMDHGALIGRCLALEERDDGPYGTFEVAPTSMGKDAYILAKEGYIRNVSVGFVKAPPDGGYRMVNGAKTAVRKRLDLRETSMTWHPAHSGATITAVRSSGEGAMTDQAAITDGAAGTPVPASAIVPVSDPNRDLLARFDALEEMFRRSQTAPPLAAAVSAPTLTAGDWMSLAVRSLAGDRITDLELRVVADLVTGDNLGVVPEQVRSELIGFIQPGRPFLSGTREVPAGDSGMEITFPRLTQKPLVQQQMAEKQELASQKTVIDTVRFGVQTYGGYGDLSIQLLKRSSPAFLDLWLRLLAEQYAIETENAGVNALLGGGVTPGGTFDPAAPAFGGAYENAIGANPMLVVNRIFLSTAAVSAMIDEREPAGGGGAPMYPALASISGEVQGSTIPIRLTPIHVPQLDNTAVDVIVGPSAGFAWAEDGTYTLQADNPAKAGRDVGLVGMMWYLPLYPQAFTTYTLAVTGAREGRTSKSKSE